jgi:hypothetical protein
MADSYVDAPMNRRQNVRRMNRRQNVKRDHLDGPNDVGLQLVLLG